VAHHAASDRDLAVLRYVRAHEQATTTAIAEAILGAPRTTFGRTLKLEQVERELADLVARKLLAVSSTTGKTIYTLTENGRQLLRDAALESGHDHPR
jgi:hypothetical protein